MKRFLIYTIIFFQISLSTISVNAASNLEILLSNDDGYNAPGIKALAEELVSIAMITVTAPANQQSGAGHGITYREPIFVRQINNPHHIPWYAITAKPATCVHIGLQNLIKTKPDLVITGINRGENIGPVTFRSGTAGAAREAAILGLPAIATSLQGDDKDDYKAAAIYVRHLVEILVSEKLLKPKLLLNVNFPSGISKGIKGTKITKLSSTDEENIYQKINFPFLEVYKAKLKSAIDNDTEVDLNAFSKGYVTITPLSLDQTNYAELNSLKVLVNE